MFNKSIKELSYLLKNKKISSIELSNIFLKRIKKDNLNIFLDINPYLIFKQAKKADFILNNKKDKITEITGIPIAHKDVFVTKKLKTTAGSKVLKNYLSIFNAQIINNFNKSGAIILGKLNCDEFSMGSSNENSFFGSVKNPWNKNKIPGGSSGGSAAAVANRLIPAATASDTGGSIRQPSAFCGVTGIKPTYGSISRLGLISFASSLDQAGIIAKTAEDCALIFNNIIKFDKNDSTSIKRPKENFSILLNKNINNVKIGLPKEFFNLNLPLEIENNIESALKEYEKLGAKLIDISLPNINLSVPVYYIISNAEVSSNLSRFDGIRYGYKKKNKLNNIYSKFRTNNFGNEVKRRIIYGTYILYDKNYKKYYLKAQKIRNLIIQDFKNNFNNINNKCDVIMSPVTSNIAWNLGKKNNPIDNYLSDIFTLSANLAGLPGISIPCGFTKKKMPIGLQIISNYFQESFLLNIANKYQQKTYWHLYKPF